MEYQQYDLKVERYQVDYEKKTVIFHPSREDSYERLLEENHQFSAETEAVEDAAVKTVMTEKMLKCLILLDSKEKTLIQELFFKDKSEYQLSRETGIPRKTLHDRKVKVLTRLKRYVSHYRR
jgi:DNA-directed RNA polymerase specialized sigma24 family protein